MIVGPRPAYCRPMTLRLSMPAGTPLKMLIGEAPANLNCDSAGGDLLHRPLALNRNPEAYQNAFYIFLRQA